MTAWEKVQLVLMYLGIFLAGYTLGDKSGWYRAERFFWNKEIREKDTVPTPLPPGPM